MQQSTERNPASSRGEDLKNALATGAVLVVILPLSLAAYGVPKLAEEGWGWVQKNLAEMVGKRKR
jgi:hypothetical protein